MVTIVSESEEMVQAIKDCLRRNLPHPPVTITNAYEYSTNSGHDLEDPPESTKEMQQAVMEALPLPEQQCPLQVDSYSSINFCVPPSPPRAECVPILETDEEEEDGGKNEEEWDPEMLVDALIKNGELSVDTRVRTTAASYVVSRVITLPSFGIEKHLIESHAKNLKEAEEASNISIVDFLRVAAAENNEQSIHEPCSPTEILSEEEAVESEEAEEQQSGERDSEEEKELSKMNKFFVPRDVLCPPTETRRPPVSHYNSSAIGSSNENGSQFLGAIENGINARGWNGSNQQQHDGRVLTQREKIIRQRYVPPVLAIDELVVEQNQHLMGPNFDAHQNVDVIVQQGANNCDTYRISSFDECALTPMVQQNLKNIRFLTPTRVQSCVIPLIQRTNSDLLCLASTGLGKTGAFMIPIVSWLEGFQYGPFGERLEQKKRSPKAIVIAHTRELVQQLAKTARIIAHGTGIGVALLMGSLDYKFIENQFMRDGCDILVATPGRLREYVQKNRIELDELHFLVVDEMDKFFSDREFIEMFSELKNTWKSKNSFLTCRTFMFSATLDASVSFTIEQFLRSDFYYVQAGKANQIVSHVRQCIVSVEILTKRDKLTQILRRAPGRKTVIFVNECRRCDRLAIALAYHKFSVISINGNRNLQQRAEAIRDFNDGKYDILVGTDVIARGMNLPNLSCVILYEMPPLHRYEQYIHRVGRAGRLGNVGEAYVFFDKGDANDRQLAEFLHEQLVSANQPVPKWLNEMVEDELHWRRVAEENGINNNRRQQQRGGGGGGQAQLMLDEDQQEYNAEFEDAGFANSNWRTTAGQFATASGWNQ